MHVSEIAMLQQVSFGVHDDEERAARMYDRAMIIEKGRGAKTNFPLSQYDGEVSQYRAYCLQTCELSCFGLNSQTLSPCFSLGSCMAGQLIAAAWVPAQVWS